MASTPTSVLVVRTDRIGDLLLTTPVFRALKEAFPSVRVGALVRPETAPLLEQNPDVDEIVLERNQPLSELVEEIRRRTFDAAVHAFCTFRTVWATRRAGIPVLLTGQGGDEVFAGYPLYLWVYLGSLLRKGRWRQALQWGGQAAHAQPLSLSRILFYALPRAMRSEARQAWARGRCGWVRRELLSGMKSREEYVDPEVGESDELEEYLRNSLLQWTLPAFLHYEDRNSMAFGVETRLPFLDYRLVEAAFRIPSEEKLKEGKTKKILRDAVRPFVPAPIVERTLKQGYPAPLSAWLKALKKEVREVAHSSVVEDCPILDAPAWNRCLEGFLNGQENQMDAVWRGLVCALWYDRFFR